MKIKEPARMKNYRLAKGSTEEELPWIRITDIPTLKLPTPIVLVNGTFDCLHSGHMKILFHARKHGKTLVVAMDSDRMVQQKKGLARPIQSWIERAVSMNYMPIDYLLEIDSDAELSEVIKLLKPSLRVKGADQRNIHSNHPDIPVLYVHDFGFRTSKIIERVKNAKTPNGIS